MPPASAVLWRRLSAYQVYGANTNVGKTVVSTLLCKAITERQSDVQPRGNHIVGYLKPLATGPLEDRDDLHLHKFAPGTVTESPFRFSEPVSPHIAAKERKAIPEDIEIQSNIRKTLSKWAADGLQHAFIETAGGVLSPGPNGTSQADLYRPLRLPIVLVADSRLGGISSSLSAFESLHVRGYDVHSVLLFEDPYYRNHEYLREYFQKRDIPLVSFPPPPDRSVSWINPDEKSRDKEAMMSYYESMARRDDISGLLEALNLREQARIDNMQSMADRTCETIWYPFTQHQGITAKDITIIDSAYGDYFQTYTKQNTGLSISSAEEQTNAQSNLLEPMFDGSASWWTQGLGHGNPDLSLAAAYAAGRYGHVMFAESIHEPALTLAELLIRSLQNPRLNKVFYSDNGSTGMEVAVKMALRAASARYGWNATVETEQGDIKVLGLKGSYHGDTIGVMDCSEPSTYNKKVEWYRGRGYWFDFPVVKMSKGAWRVEIPMTLQAQLGSDNVQFSSLNDVFNLRDRRNTTISSKYQQFIKNTIEHLVSREGYRFGALIMEPVILGAGGMLFIDPLFQHSLATVVRENPHLFGTPSSSSMPNPTTSQGKESWSGLPIICDEVFTGLYRLGRISSTSFLDFHADISVHAKLLTGGLLPLSITLSSNEIYHAFQSSDKTDALLHGHSYTAHAIGCQVAETSLRRMINMERDGEWKEFMKNWTLSSHTSTPTPKPMASSNGSYNGDVRGTTMNSQLANDHFVANLKAGAAAAPQVWSCWSQSFIRDVSLAESVESVTALGFVLSLTLHDESGSGYTSSAAKVLQQKLAVYSTTREFGIHSRVLGNVLYLMASMTSQAERLHEIEAAVLEGLKTE